MQTAAQSSNPKVASKKMPVQPAKSTKNSRITHKGLLQTTLKSSAATNPTEGMKQFLQQTLNLPLTMGAQSKAKSGKTTNSKLSHN